MPLPSLSFLNVTSVLCVCVCVCVNTAGRSWFPQSVFIAFDNASIRELLLLYLFMYVVVSPVGF